MSTLLRALEAKYEADMLKAKANIDVYVRSSVGIGEHPDLVEAIDTQLEALAEAEAKRSVLQNHYGAELRVPYEER